MLSVFEGNSYKSFRQYSCCKGAFLSPGSAPPACAPQGMYDHCCDMGLLWAM